MKPLCCICQPGCAGVDADLEGGIACTLECAPCLHGCPSPLRECCVDELVPVLSLWEPWATAMGRTKFVETRSWRPSLPEGADLIFAGTAGKKPMRDAVAAAPELIDDLADAGVSTIDFGRIQSRVRYEGAVPTDDCIVDPTIERGWVRDDDGRVHISRLELRWGDYSPGRWAWLTSNAHHFENPPPFSGGQKLTRRISLAQIAAIEGAS